MRYLLSFIGMAAGAFIVIYSERFYDAFGPIQWAEEHLAGSGGSRVFYKLFGLAVIFIALFYMSGILQSIGLAIFGRLLGL